MRNSMENEHQKKKLNTALYLRLSREDGDQNESLSIRNQRLLLTEYVNSRNDLQIYDTYIDDGYSGTNFNRPEFQRMIEDIESKNIQCVVVKDLSRLGRNMSKVTDYISEYFPSKKIRFIAINDNVDKEYDGFNTSEDMLIDMKNMFNGFYPKDISKKVRSTFRSKQTKGQFIGAFPSYGYRKSEEDHNQLEIDEYAAEIVRRIFNMYLNGKGQITIAKILNEEGIPCPTEYKKNSGMKYHNGSRLKDTSYWTYSTIRKILMNEIYIGNMVQNKTFRQVCKKKAISLPREKWIIVENTHEAIIDRETWDKVQELLKRNTRQTGLTNNIHMFAGVIQCADCNRAMVKLKRKGKNVFHCGSYNRYGKSFCSAHFIMEEELESIILNDLNLIIKSMKNLSAIIENEQRKEEKDSRGVEINISKFQVEIEKLERKKARAYEDYLDELISKEEYVKYKERYEKQINHIQSQLNMIVLNLKEESLVSNSWVEKLLLYGKLDFLDRDIIVEMISMIYVHEDCKVKIVYSFSNELETLLQTNSNIT